MAANEDERLIMDSPHLPEKDSEYSVQSNTDMVLSNPYAPLWKPLREPLKFSGVKHGERLPKNCIRLWNIKTNEIEAISVATSLKRSQCYVAISHTWQDAQTISDQMPPKYSGLGFQKPLSKYSKTALPDSLMPILQAIKAAVLQYNQTNYVWVDYLCIDQADEDDAQFQIPYMHDVFRRAECVIVLVNDFVGVSNGDLHYDFLSSVSSLAFWKSRVWTSQEEHLCRKLALYGTDGLRKVTGLDQRQDEVYQTLAQAMARVSGRVSTIEADKVYGILGLLRYGPLVAYDKNDSLPKALEKVIEVAATFGDGTWLISSPYPGSDQLGLSGAPLITENGILTSDSSTDKSGYQNHHFIRKVDEFGAVLGYEAKFIRIPFKNISRKPVMFNCYKRMLQDAYPLENLHDMTGYYSFPKLSFFNWGIRSRLAVYSTHKEEEDREAYLMFPANEQNFLPTLGIVVVRENRNVFRKKGIVVAMKRSFWTKLDIVLEDFQSRIPFSEFYETTVKFNYIVAGIVFLIFFVLACILEASLGRLLITPNLGSIANFASGSSSAASTNGGGTVFGIVLSIGIVFASASALKVYFGNEKRLKGVEFVDAIIS